MNRIPAESRDDVQNAAPPHPVRRPLSRPKKLFFAAVALGTFLVALELLLQVAALLSPPVACFLSRYGHSYVLPDDTYGTRLNVNWFEHDERGYRNVRGLNTAHIVVLGDSQVYGTGVAREHAWPQVLGQLTGRIVYNLGVPGSGPLVSCARLPDALALQPRLVLLCVYTGNDFFDDYYNAYKRQILPAARADDPAVAANLAAYDHAHPFDDAQLRSQARPRGLQRVILEHCRLYGVARGIAARCRSWKGPAVLRLEQPHSWDEALREIAGRSDCHVFVDGDFRMIFSPQYRLLALNVEDPRICEGIRLTQWSARDIAARVRATGADVAVVLIPTKELVFRARITQAGDAATIALYEPLWRNEEQALQMLKAGLDEQGIRWIDTIAALQQATAHEPYPYAVLANGHPNPAGTAVIAQAVADALATAASAGGSP